MHGLRMGWTEPEWTNRLQRVQICHVLVESSQLGMLLVAPRGGLLPTAGDDLNMESINNATDAAFAELTAQCPKCKNPEDPAHRFVHTCQKGKKEGLVGSLVPQYEPRGKHLLLRSDHMRGKGTVLDKVRRMISGFAAVGFRIALVIDMSIHAGIDLQSVL